MATSKSKSLSLKIDTAQKEVITAKERVAYQNFVLMDTISPHRKCSCQIESESAVIAAVDTAKRYLAKQESVLSKLYALMADDMVEMSALLHPLNESNAARMKLIFDLLNETDNE